MSTLNNEEKGLLGSSGPHRRYGTITVNMKKPDFVIRHEVLKSDTLQGIALKYGVSVSIVYKLIWSVKGLTDELHINALYRYPLCRVWPFLLVYLVGKKLSVPKV